MTAQELTHLAQSLRNHAQTLRFLGHDKSVPNVPALDILDVANLLAAEAADLERRAAALLVDLDTSS